ncbi:AEC family transporter [Pannonibacter phragmitetus]|uniref:AEC family transporter n=1 Tax=Pannonibacter phragmitetus TaxID=121719 RepID=UPI003D2EDE86
MFEQILTIVVPVFVLVGLGYLAARTGLLSQSVGEGLGQFVFVVAIPSLIFKTLATVSMDQGFPGRYGPPISAALPSHGRLPR